LKKTSRSKTKKARKLSWLFLVYLGLKPN